MYVNTKLFKNISLIEWTYVHKKVFFTGLIMYSNCSFVEFGFNTNSDSFLK